MRLKFTLCVLKGSYAFSTFCVYAFSFFHLSLARRAGRDRRSTCQSYQSPCSDQQLQHHDDPQPSSCPTYTYHTAIHRAKNRLSVTAMFASRHNHAFRGHQPDKENMITQTPLRPGMAFKTPMTQRTLYPSSSKMMMNGGGMHTVGPKRVQMSEKDGCRTELRPRVGPSLNRNGANLAGGASPFAAKGKGKGVELGKPQQLGNHEPTSGFDVNLGKSTSGRLSKGRFSTITPADPCLLDPARPTYIQVLNAFSPTRPARPLSNRPPILFRSRPTPPSHLSSPFSFTDPCLLGLTRVV